MTSKVQIKQHIEAILTYMQPHWEFVNCHMVNYLTDQHWQRFVPTELHSEVCNVQQVQRCIETVFWRNENASDDFTAFRKFLRESEKHRLEQYPDILTNLQDLRQKLGVIQENENLSIKEFMSEKKRHEVEITADLINDIMQHVQRKDSATDLYIIDAGDGKGYLSSRLALQYQHKVLGIDFNKSNTESALERNRKLQRSWHALTERAELQSKGIIPPRRGKGPKRECKNSDNNVGGAPQNYKTTSKFISPELDFMHLLNEFFPIPNNEPQLCLTGLHTCGNLAPTCFKVFHAQKHFKILCNIGCCYHLLKEEFSEQEFFGNKALMDMQFEAGFPMSTFLRERRVRLGRNARMLASQSIERTVAAQELPNISLFYRALLEVAICEHDINLKDTIQVGKVRKFENFQHYLEICSRKAQLELDDLSLEHVEKLKVSYASHKNYLDLFYLLRMTFAPVLESLILLDRLLYLQELNYEQSYLISLFDAIKSPRHYCVVAIKS